LLPSLDNDTQRACVRGRELPPLVIDLVARGQLGPKRERGLGRLDADVENINNAIASALQLN
jgi:hypothetical protein